MRLGIIGFGHLGHALADGLLKQGFSAGDICVCSRRESTLQNARDVCGFTATNEVNGALSSSDVIFLTVKAAVFEELAKKLDIELLAGRTVVSFMAGMTMERLRELLPGAEVVRAMPSVAIASCDGVIGYTKAPDAVAEIFSKLGYAFEVEPEQIEKVMAFSACGLGFAAYLMNAFVCAGESMGFTREESEKITEKTFRNAADIGNYDATVTAVATKGGATEQGVLHMDACGVKAAVAGAVGKAYQRMV